MRTIFKQLTLIVGLAGGAAASAGNYELKVTDKGFQPSSISAKAGEDVTLLVTRLTDSTCATEIQVPSKKLSFDLPLNKAVTVKLGKLERGKVNFGCGMNMMMGGVITAK